MSSQTRCYGNFRESNNSDQTDSDYDIEGIYKFKERELKESCLPFPTLMYNVDRPNMSTSEIVDTTKFLVSVISEPNWEALAFPKDCNTGKNCLNEEREILIPTSKYVHARLKCWDDRFAANP